VKWRGTHTIKHKRNNYALAKPTERISVHPTAPNGKRHLEETTKANL